MPDDRTELERSRRRLGGFRNHLIAYFAVGTALVVLNVMATPDTIWFVWPIVGWGGVLAIHAAYAMGLFRGRKES
jgi:2TM domain